MQLNQHRWLTLWSRVIWSKEPPLNEAKYQCKLKQEKKHDMLVPDLLLTPLRTRSDSLCTQLTRPSTRSPRGAEGGGGRRQHSPLRTGTGGPAAAARQPPTTRRQRATPARQDDCLHRGSPRLSQVPLERLTQIYRHLSPEHEINLYPSFECISFCTGLI